MNCPTCGSPMQTGHITGQNVMRLVPETADAKKPTRQTSRDFSHSEYRRSELPGYPLDVAYAGMAPWISAHYCLGCRKAHCQLDILIPDGEVSL